ncbi:uncharacterized protein METZ01_LOCUS514276, partial [marine metagenome]
VEDALEIVMAVTAPLKRSPEIAEVGYEIKSGRGLLGSVAAVEVGADPDVGGSAEKLTVVVKMVGQGLEISLRLVAFGCDAPLPAGDNHPYVEGETDDGATLGQSLYL